MVVFLVKDKTIAVIGAGSLGSEVISSLKQNGHDNIIATRNNEYKLAELREQYNINTTTDNEYASKNADIIVLAVKPYKISEVCTKIYADNKLVISLAAAVSISELESSLANSRVARAMTGISVADEIAAYTKGTTANNYDVSAIKYIFGEDAIEVEEKGLADRTWIACDTGLIAKSLENKINSLDGLSSEQAHLMYAATLESLAKQIRAGKSGEEIYNNVAGPGSFTGKLKDMFEENGLYSLYRKGIESTISACRK